MADSAIDVRHGSSDLSQKLRALQSLNTRLMCMDVDNLSYQDLVDGVAKVVGCDACALYLHDRTRDELVLEGAAGYEVDERDRRLQLDDASRIHCQVFREEYMVYIPTRDDATGNASFDNRLDSNLVFPIIANQGPVGVFGFGSYVAGAFGPEDVDLCAMLVDQMAYSLENMRLLRELSRSRDAVIRGMALLAESRDKNIGGHLDRICASAKLLAGWLMDRPEYPEVTHGFIETIARAAALHDIGKVGIPDRVLLKADKLNEAEFEVMKTHTVIGADLLENLMSAHGSYTMIKMGAEIARAHHEWWDGTGYPLALERNQISLPARIVAVADVYDALTSKRVYKSAWEHDEAVDSLRAGSGKQFDPALVAIFLSHQDDLQDIRLQYPD